MFVQLSSHTPAFNGVRDYLDNVAAAVRALFNAISGQKPQGSQKSSAAPQENVCRRRAERPSRLPDEVRLYRMMSGSDSVSPAVGAELEAIVSRNRLN